MMRISIAMLFLVALLAPTMGIQFELKPYNPVANSSAVVQRGSARFTVLTSRVIRVEYSQSGNFEDRASLAFLNRNTAVPTFTTTTTGNVLTISTSAITLSYLVGAPFSAGTLNITLRSSGQTYHWGDVDYGNLLGTIRTLDELGVTTLNCTQNANISIHQEQLHCTWALFSRGGWTTVNDQDNYMLGSTSQWWESYNTDQIDTYFFGHGQDYLGAIADYVLLGGNTAMTPRASMGIMWSRWLNLNDNDVFQIVRDYQDRGIPLDNFILDMDWHTKQGWGAFSFDKNLFPIPEAVMKPLKAMGLLTSGNLHDANGIAPYEDQYSAFCAAMGANPAANQTFAFDIANETYALAVEDVILKPLQDQGFGDFWWIDWQQGGTQGGCKGGKMNPTILLNRLRGTSNIRRGETQRGMILARYGGLGSHRYQVGFSGDVQDVSWANLAYQPYFSFTASNVLFGFWSHDLVGPFGAPSTYDWELYTRWLQWGAFSSVFRTHDRGMASGACAQDDPATCAVIKMWDAPTPYFEAIRAAVQERHRLLPYLYNGMWKAYNTGISIMRPLYYYWPAENNAYLGDQNGNYPAYMLGDDMVVIPVVTAGYNNDTLARVLFWLPPGTWINELTGDVVQGNITVQGVYDLSEVPRYVRAGAVIPKLPLVLGKTIGRAMQQYTSLEVHLYTIPGTSSGSVDLYEDDAVSTDYLNGKYATTTISFKRSAKQLQISVATPQGGYDEMPTQRDYTFRYTGSPPTSATINGAAVSFSSTGGPNTWWYDGPCAQVVIQTAVVPVNSALTVVVVPSAFTTDEAPLFGLKGQVSRANLAKQTLDPSWSTPGAQIVQPARLTYVASAGVSLSYLAGTNVSAFASLVQGFPAAFALAQSEVLGLKPYQYFPSNALVQWWSASRNDSCLCSHTTCNTYQSESGYVFERIEGYIPEDGAASTVPIQSWWNPIILDNYALTNSLVSPSGYSKAVFSDGSLFASQQPGTTNCSSWFSSARMDWLTVCSAQGVQYAQRNGYTLGNATIGWAYIDAPLMKKRATAKARDNTTPPTLAQWSRALDLIIFSE